MAKSAEAPDWTRPLDYAGLERAGRSAFAWEWLRRSEAYREAAASAFAPRQGSKDPLREDPQAAPWRLHAFEDPRLDSVDARPVWTADGDPFVLRCRAECSAPGPDCFNLGRFAGLARVVAGRSGDHLLLSDGARSIRLDIRGARLRGAPVRLHYRLFGARSLEKPLLTLRRFAALLRHGRFLAGLFPRDPRTRRLLLLLRAFDGLRSGATQRDIAHVLLCRGEAAVPRWRLEQPSLRSRAQRLAVSARRFASGGFWRLLD